MSVWGRRDSYSATTFVVVFFVAIASLAHLSQPYIAERTNPDFATSPSDFFRVARHQSVEWHEWTPEAVALARRLDRPLLIFFGTVWGELRPKFDSFAEDSDISEQMNREFVCVRIDSMMHPIWRAGPLQLERSQRGDPSTFGIAIIAPEGTVIALPSIQELQAMNDRAMLTFLRRSLNAYAGKSTPELHANAISEAFNLTGGVSSTPGSALAYATRLSELADPVHGGFRGRAERELSPLEFESMLDYEMIVPVEAALAPIVRGPVHDALWGGYFERWSPAEQRVVFAKTAFDNAEMLNLLARLAAVTDKPLYRNLARQQFTYVADRFAPADSPVYEFAEYRDANRSPRHSFSPRRLSQTVDSDQLEFARSALGLNVQENPQATPYFAEPEAYFRDPKPLDAILAQMRSKVADTPERAGRFSSYEAQAVATAAMLRTARFLREPELTATATQAFEELRSRMRAGLNDVLTAPPSGSSATTGLGAYLAYGSAAWEMMMLSGDSEVGRDGLAVMDRARFLFTDADGGIDAGEAEPFGPEWQKLFGPEVLDFVGASSTGEFIRLAGLYGRWNASSRVGRELRHSQETMIQRTGWILDPIRLRAGALAHALSFEESPLVIHVPKGSDLGPVLRSAPRAVLLPSSEGWFLQRSGRWQEFPDSTSLLRSL